MLSHIAQGFLGHAIQFVLDLFRNLVLPSIDVECALNAAITRKTFRQLLKGCGQARAFEQLWPQAKEHPARVLQATFGQFPGLSQTVANVRRRTFDGTVGRLEVEQYPGEFLCEGVMNLASHPVALLSDSRGREGFHDLAEVHGQEIR